MEQVAIVLHCTEMMCTVWHHVLQNITYKFISSAVVSMYSVGSTEALLLDVVFLLALYHWRNI